MKKVRVLICMLVMVFISAAVYAGSIDYLKPKCRVFYDLKQECCNRFG